MTADEQVQRLAAALRAQASGFPAGFPTAAPTPAAEPPEQHEQPAPRSDGRATQGRSGLPARAVLILAVLLGALAGGLAGVISIW